MTEPNDLEAQFAELGNPDAAVSAEHRLARLELHNLANDIARQTGVDPETAKALVAIKKAHPTMSLTESLRLHSANVAQADQDQTSSFDPGQHASLATGKSGLGRPATKNDEAQDFAARVKFVREARNVDAFAADEVRTNLIGGLAAKALGLTHHKIPLPGKR